MVLRYVGMDVSSRIGITGTFLYCCSMEGYGVNDVDTSSPKNIEVEDMEMLFITIH